MKLCKKMFMVLACATFAFAAFAQENCLANGGFETGDLTGWKIENPTEKGAPKVEKNKSNAKEGDCYLTAWDKDSFDFMVSQTVSGMSAGKYKCVASFQGTSVKNPSGTQLKVTVTKKDGTTSESVCDVKVPNIWKKFFTAEIPGIVVDSPDDSVTVSAHMKAENDGGAGPWLMIDEVSLTAE